MKGWKVHWLDCFGFSIEYRDDPTPHVSPLYPSRLAAIQAVVTQLETQKRLLQENLTHARQQFRQESRKKPENAE